MWALFVLLTIKRTLSLAYKEVGPYMLRIGLKGIHLHISTHALSLLQEVEPYMLSRGGGAKCVDMWRWIPFKPNLNPQLTC